jgi:hypothetical protein
LQDREAQERGARDLQKPAPQTAPGIGDLGFNDSAIQRFRD